MRHLARVVIFEQNPTVPFSVGKKNVVVRRNTLCAVSKRWNRSMGQRIQSMI